MCPPSRARAPRGGPSCKKPASNARYLNYARLIARWGMPASCAAIIRTGGTESLGQSVGFYGSEDNGGFRSEIGGLVP